MDLFCFLQDSVLQSSGILRLSCFSCLESESALPGAAPCSLHAATPCELRHDDNCDDSGTAENLNQLLTVLLCVLLLLPLCCIAAVRTPEHTSNYYDTIHTTAAAATALYFVCADASHLFSFSSSI